MLLAGGQGERLYPLTKDRAKPAVPFAGVYRIIDFTLSNCINSGIRRIHVLTQYKSISLHRHVLMGWNIFNTELGEFIDLIPPQQRTSESWYLGTADAIFQNIYTLDQERPGYVLILAGDHIYRMDYGEMLEFHVENQADLTIACVEVPRTEATRLGVMEVDASWRVVGFEEKPAEPKPLPERPDQSLASMGIYVFNTEKLVRELFEDARRGPEETSHDFGKDIIPHMVRAGDRVFAFPFRDAQGRGRAYWRDIGTLDSYYAANMELIQAEPIFDLYDPQWPWRTYQHQLPPAKTVHAYREQGRVGMALDSLLSPGCIVSGGQVERVIMSPRVRINSFAFVSDSILMENVNVGRHARIQRAIIDKDVDIPPGDVIGFNLEEDRRRFKVTEGGIVVVPKGLILGKPDGSVP
jgi:glucose-1-phosphate adenylyltransferase